ncbi:hypothetical protein [Kribbella sp. ALI-6-A]|uniref:hypothetical protein n=1 Tax=Kribbella sp. ALI-6-A TaxID=1933817 RepID=UPI00117B4CFE|nr:hypothetical protein [Kribbella sp. ALI-6-A]
MTAKRWVFVVVAVVGLAPLIAALVEQQWGTAVFRTFPVVIFGALAVKEFRSPSPPQAWTKRQLVLTLALVVPLTAVTYGVIIWVVVRSGEPYLLVGCVALLLVCTAMLGLGARVLRKEHLLATGAAGSTDS